jgi:cell division septation protein DedD
MYQKKTMGRHLVSINLRASLVFIIITLSCGHLSADMLISRADQRRKAGDAETAAQLYAGWLHLNPGASGAARVFESWFSVEQDFPTLLSESALFLTTGKGIAGADRQFLRIARMYDLAGRLEDARNVYLAAASQGATDSALVSAFLLSMEMNDVQSMAESLSRLSGKGGSADLLLGALSALKAGDVKSARTTLLGLASQTGDPDLSVRALWVLYATALQGGDKEGQGTWRNRLASRFPSAPETALAAVRPGLVVIAPGPEALAAAELSPARSAPEPATQAPAPDAAQPTPQVPAAAPQTGPQTGAQTAAPSPRTTFSVQAGSFQMKENSDDLVAELAKKGFTAVAVEETVQGKHRYRVLAGTGMESDQAKSVLLRLSQAGFSGFLVSDK